MFLLAHQKEGVEFLLSRRSGILAFEQGLGKTIVALQAFSCLRKSGKSDRMVVICPNSLKRNWCNEVERFASDETVSVIEGRRSTRRQTLSRLATSIVLIGYESARNDVVGIRALLQRSAAVLVLDESHYTKNYHSLNSIAARHFADLVEHRWLLTGTPITNSPIDIYAQVCLVSDNRPLGSYAAFVAKFGYRQVDDAKLNLLADMVRPYTLRKVKEECIDLPSKSFRDIVVELPAWQRRLYAEVKNGIVGEVSRMSSSEFARHLPTALVRVLRLAQVASNPALVFPVENRTPGKVEQLDELIAELITSGRKVVVWSYYVKTIRRLAERYQKLGCGSLYGDVPVDERHAIVSRFQDGTDVNVLLCNPGVAGTGYTLTAANYAIYETIGWRYDHFAQSQDRIHRIGQRLPVSCIRLMAENTIDNAIAESLERKACVASGILDRGRPSLNEIVGDKATFLEMVSSGHLPN